MSNLITSKNQLIDYVLKGSKPKSIHSIGIEFENILYNKNTYRSLPYSSVDGASIEKILNGFNKSIWSPILEKGKIIGLKSAVGSISLEPAGQLEFAPNPISKIEDLKNVIKAYYQELLSIITPMNVGVYTIGYNPVETHSQLPLMPKERYNIMYSYMPKVGSLGVEMMKLTCTLQTNIDFESEADLAKKFKVATIIQPILGAIYANSTFIQGQPTKYQSFRNHIWNNTDNARTGLLQFAIDEEFTVEKYIDYVLQVPMYFLIRDNNYLHSATGVPFAKVINNEFSEAGPATMEDFELHITTAFPDVRLKQYIETRSTDCPNVNLYPSLAALIKGLIYSDNALDTIISMTNKWSFNDIQTMKYETITKGLNAEINGEKVQNIALKLIDIAYETLKQNGLNEEVYLEEIKEMVKTNTLLVHKSTKFFEENGKDINKLIDKLSISNDSF